MKMKYSDNLESELRSTIALIRDKVEFFGAINRRDYGGEDISEDIVLTVLIGCELDGSGFTWSVLAEIDDAPLVCGPALFRPRVTTARIGLADKESEDTFRLPDDKLAKLWAEYLLLSV